MKNTLLFITISLLLYGNSLAYLEKPQHLSNLERIPHKPLTSEVVGTQRLESLTGIPRAIYSPNYQVLQADPESMARQYLLENAQLLQHGEAANDLKFIQTIETPGGYRVQFMQQTSGYIVYRASIKVSLNRDGVVVFVMNGYQTLGHLDPSVKVPEAQALSLARNYLSIGDKNKYERIETVVYNGNLLEPRLVHKVNIVPSGDLLGDWELLIDAQTSEVIRVEDLANYQDGARENGSAWVFDPDPITDAVTLYGQSGFTDNGDADSDSLTAHLKSVILEDISFEHAQYRLMGPYAVIVDVEPPMTGLYAQDSSSFNYTRSDAAFEAANIYYHVHQSMKYLNEDLGFNVMPIQYEGGVQFDPHGLNGEVNAHFVPSLGIIAFGSPANRVDAGEDAAIIIHELGHGIHHWITGGMLSQVDGLSEGLGDYWAQSFTRSLGILEPSDVQYDYFGQWGLQAWGSPYLRTTNFPNHYPEGLGGEVHYDGQLWASSLMSIYDLIGKRRTDQNCWEGISMTDINSNQVDAAFAFIQADIDLFSGNNLGSIMPVFIDRGYVTSPIIAGVNSDVTGGVSPLLVTFEDQSVSYPGNIISWEWDFDGDGHVDSEEQNPSYAYTAPGQYSVHLTVSDGSQSNTIVKENYVSVNAGVLVFDGELNGTDYSGDYIFEQLSELNIDVVYSNRIWSSLQGFDAVFLSLGNLGEAGESGTFLKHANYYSIMEYVEAGGKIYVEGGSFLSVPSLFSYPYTETLWDLFGVESAELIFGNMPVSELAGVDSSLAENIIFTSSTQINNWYIDHPPPSANGLAAFTDTYTGDLGIQTEGDSNQKTFYFSYSLAELIDGDGNNTRRSLLLSIVEFFDIPFLTPAFSGSVNSGHAPLSVSFEDRSYSFPEVTSWAWDFNEDGIIDSDQEQAAWTYVDSGSYSVSLTVGNAEFTETITVENDINVFLGESSLNFTENDNEVDVSASETLNLIEEMTIETWINPTAWGGENNGDGRIIDKGYIRLMLNNSGSSLFADSSLVVIIKHQDGTLSKTNTPANSIELNEWQYIAVTYTEENSEIHVYIDGVDQTIIVDAPSGAIRDNVSRDLKIGNDYSSSFAFKGRLDEIRIWDTALSLEDLAAGMLGVLEGNETGLVAYWSMNEGNGNQITDLTGNQNHGTIASVSWAWGTDFLIPVSTDNPIYQPVDHLVLENYPNPFNPSTTIRFGLPEASRVTLSIFDIRGHLVKTINTGVETSGWYELQWQGDDNRGHSVATGVYYARLQADRQSEVVKMLLLK